MDRQGKQNLYDILSDAWIHTASPDIAVVAAKVDDLWKYSEGLIILNGFRGDLAQFVKEDNKKKLQDRLEHYQNTTVTDSVLKSPEQTVKVKLILKISP